MNGDSDMSIEQIIAEHPDWTDQQIADAANAPVYSDVPLSAVAALLVGYKRALLDAVGGLPSELARGVIALVEATESPHLKVIAAADVPQMHALAAAAATAMPAFAGLAAALQGLGVTRANHTAEDVAAERNRLVRSRLIEAGRAAYDVAVQGMNEDFNRWVGMVQRGETTDPWGE